MWTSLGFWFFLLYLLLYGSFLSCLSLFTLTANHPLLEVCNSEYLKPYCLNIVSTLKIHNTDSHLSVAENLINWPSNLLSLMAIYNYLGTTLDANGTTLEGNETVDNIMMMDDVDKDCGKLLW